MTSPERFATKGFEGKRAVITGGGSGIGREIALQLVAEGCSVATCDLSAENLAETRRLCEAAARAGTKVTTFVCDVADESQMLAFRDSVAREHGHQIELLFNNAGVNGGWSFVAGDRAEWERTFAVCWWGVYYGTRAFLPLLVASDGAAIVNTSSMAGFWPTVFGAPCTAYGTAKFAVKGFSEALVADLRENAPHVRVVLVMPGHVGTSIVENSRRALGHGGFEDMTADEVLDSRKILGRFGMPVDEMSDEQVRAAMASFAVGFREGAPLTALEAARIILDGVRAGRWRIIVGDDARRADQLVREDPEMAFEPAFLERLTSRA